MKTFFHLFSDAVVSAFGWTLIHSLWQGAAIAAIGGTSFYLLRKKPSGIRYNIALSLLFSQVFFSACTFLLYFQTFSNTSAASTVGQRPTALPQLFTNNIPHKLPVSMQIKFWMASHMQELVTLWLIGASILLIRFLGGWLFTEHLRATATPIADRQWRARLGVLTARMNIGKSIEFKETARVMTPLVIGAISPVILIPIGLLSGFSVAQVEAILAHELAHIRRNDYFANMLQSLVEVIYFFHPAIWWLSTRIRDERENCCDDIAVAISGDRQSLAHALVKVAEWQSAPRMAMAFASKKPLLLTRIRRVMGLNVPEKRSFAGLPVLLTFIGLFAGISFVAVAQKEKAEKKAATHKRIIITRGKTITIPAYGDTIITAPVPEDILDTAGLEEPKPDTNLDITLEEPEIEVNVDNDIVLRNLNSSLAFLGSNFNQDKLSPEEREKLHRRLEEIRVEIEKKQFDMERSERAMEKLEMRKDLLSDARRELMDERRDAMDESRDKEQKPGDNELDRILEDFETKISQKENEITTLTKSIADARNEVFKVEEPLRNLENELRDIEGKLGGFDEANMAIVRELRGLKIPPPPARPATAKTLKNAKAPAGVKPVKPVAPPKPPLPPAKK